ncbi:MULTISPECIES: helix-turn-helix transcriptional regulator [Planococcus]|uniref:Transcriptional regulator n=1 Tax=Planococcus faecalis TaxID=1598147 RepID=A0ABM6ISX6_9BACL|nr:MULTISPECIES: helix-turn-helix transcriptional regulator [Planococcus]AQU79477.1 transcriptional regulator [Planococcus faecalis]MDJ0332557.1 helix-turn-helix transcriptional regulator [Planococcus sp. S3-L1]OHX51442.1 transcriptional regulator [Planococcus faecalis]
MKTRLKELSTNVGINQTELAKCTKTSRQTVSLIECEEFMPSLLVATKIARIFDKPVQEIFQFDEEELA